MIYHPEKPLNRDVMQITIRTVCLPSMRHELHFSGNLSTHEPSQETLTIDRHLPRWNSLSQVLSYRNYSAWKLKAALRKAIETRPRQQDAGRSTLGLIQYALIIS